MRFNRKSFFDGYREVFGRLGQAQVDGIEFLLGKMEADSRWKNVQEIAYALSTVDHETDHTFQPITEKRASRIKQPTLWASQNRYWKTNHMGRGYVQLTWPENYERYGIKDDPDRALDPEMAYEILTDGMHKGVYTGKKLSDYINDKETDYFNARRIVNKLDKASLIAKNAGSFEAILRVAAGQPPEVEPEQRTEPPEIKVEPPSAPQPAHKPEVLPVSAPKGSILTKIAAAASAAGPVIGATGLKIGGVEFKTGGLIAMAAIIITGMICATVIYIGDRNRSHEKQILSMQNLADPSKANVVAAGSKV